MTRCLVALVVCSAMPLTALGQLYTRTILNRPSDQSASSRIGQTGGTNTRIGAQELLGQRNPRTLDRIGMGQLPLTRPGPFVVPDLLRSAQLGVGVSASARPRPYRTPYVYDPSQIRDASFLSQALSFELPLRGAPPAVVVVPDRALLGRGSTDPFKRIFGLAEPRVSMEGATRSGIDEGVTSMGELFTQENDKLTQDSLRRALVAFREGTTAQLEDRYDRLRTAARLLASASATNPHDPLPLLLGIHAAAAQDRFGTAWLNLRRAVERDPAIFMTRIDLRVYFGDPRILEEQARNLSRATDPATMSADALAFAAYGAWLLGDTGELNRILSALEQRVGTSGADQPARAVYFALAAAARQG